MLSKKVFLVIGAVVLLIGVLLWLRLAEKPVEVGQMGRVCFAEKCFQVELAKTQSQRVQGLMFRQTLAEDRGMLFIFDTSDVYSFWMKNTLIPLDIIWLSEQGQVVDMAENVLPCQETICPGLTPKAKALYVLEINAGLAKKLDLAIDSRVAIDFSE